MQLRRQIADWRVVKRAVQRWPSRSYRNSMSAVLVLRSPSGADGRFYDAHWRDIQRECGEIGLKAQRGLGVYFEHELLMKSEMGRRMRMRNLSLGDGDFYVFNSNRLHEIFPIPAGSTRVTCGTFIGVDNSSILMY